MKAPVPLLIVCAACAPDRGVAYGRSLALAEQAEMRHAYGEAAARYDEAAADAKVARDGDHARFLAAIAEERAGDKARALARLDAIASHEPPLEDSDDASYRAAMLRIDESDPSGYPDLEAMVRRFPGSGLAKPALHRLVIHMDEKGDAATIDYLRGLDRALGSTETGEEIAYEIALRLARLGRTQEARDAFVAIARRWPYPNGLLYDDSLYRASELDEQLGRYADAVADLRSMLSTRESSWISGSYERPRYDAAQLRIGELYASRLHDDARARVAFHSLYADFPTSALRDKALWSEAELAARDGDVAARCGLLKDLVHDFPDSRYVPCVAERCPEVRAPSSSHAPRSCHAYIERAEPTLPR